MGERFESEGGEGGGFVPADRAALELLHGQREIAHLLREILKRLPPATFPQPTGTRVCVRG